MEAMKKFNVDLKALGISLLLVAIVLSSGCTVEKSTSDKAKDACVELCRSAQNNPQVNMSAGPCLSENGQWSFKDWVCDVAHSPRQAVDDLPENQCAKFRNGDAQFFVEVSPDCRIINSNCCY